MKVLVLNCGSSSIKYKLFDMTSGEVMAQGGIEKIGLPGAFLKLTDKDGKKVVLEKEMPGHKEGIEFILSILTDKTYGCIKEYNEIDAVGHRVVHGGEKFASSVKIDRDVINKVIECSDLAPLHNPANLKGIDAMEALIPGIPQVAVFDTAFHQTMPAKAYMYGLPYEMYTKYGVRRYGFHGTSHRYVSRRACEILGVPYEEQKIITAHVGNGGSIAAVDHGKCVDTSMGLTPVEGLLMGTRCGDVDAGALSFIMEKEGLDLEINGDYISAKGTSLGGDDGIAVAYTLAVLDDEEMAHPPIEAIFTVNEEIGMLGAATIDVSDLKGRLFMNMDSEDEGVFTVSCAGGASVICKIPYETETVNASVIEIKMTGFAGGHSGVEIIKGRLNANCAMARVLLSLFNEVEMQLVSVNGGEKDNAIAKFSEASVAVLPEELEAAKQIVEDTFAQIKEEYKVTDPDAKLTVNVKEATNIETFTEDTTFAVVTAMVHMPNGVQRMNPEIEGLVQTSLNMGILTTEESEVQMTFAVRSSSETEKQYLIDQLTSLTETLGGNVEIAGPYPGWEYKADSRLREVMVEAYKHLYNGEEPVVEGIHAGLECGIFASKLPGLDAVSFGPQMEHTHTTNEVLSISSTERTWELVVKTLAALK